MPHSQCDELFIIQSTRLTLSTCQGYNYGIEIKPMSTVTKHSNTLFDIETAKGKLIAVSWKADHCIVYVPSNNSNKMPMGKRFSSLVEALESYKSKDVKAALYALLES